MISTQQAVIKELKYLDLVVNEFLEWRAHFTHLKKKLNQLSAYFLKLWYGKTQVTSSEFRVASFKLPVESLKARVEFQMHEFKFTSYEFQSASHEFKSTS